MDHFTTDLDSRCHSLPAYHEGGTNDLYEMVKTFIDDEDIYSNPHEIELSCYDDDALLLAAFWPNTDSYGEFTTELSWANVTITDFIETFDITSIQSIDDITPEMLLRLYEQGKVSVFCFIDRHPYYYALYFHKINGKVVARKDDGSEHTVTITLETHDQYEKYMYGYFGLLNE